MDGILAGDSSVGRRGGSGCGCELKSPIHTMWSAASLLLHERHGAHGYLTLEPPLPIRLVPPLWIDHQQAETYISAFPPTWV